MNGFRKEMLRFPCTLEKSVVPDNDADDEVALSKEVLNVFSARKKSMDLVAPVLYEELEWIQSDPHQPCICEYCFTFDDSLDMKTACNYKGTGVSGYIMRTGLCDEREANLTMAMEPLVNCTFKENCSSVLETLRSETIKALDQIFDSEEIPKWPLEGQGTHPTLMQLLATDAALECDHLRLPIVILPEDQQLFSEAESKSLPLSDGLDLCGLQCQSNIHLDLYLDWSLCNPPVGQSHRGFLQLLSAWAPRSTHCHQFVRYATLKPSPKIYTCQDTFLTLSELVSFTIPQHNQESCYCTSTTENLLFGNPDKKVGKRPFVAPGVMMLSFLQSMKNPSVVELCAKSRTLATNNKKLLKAWKVD